MKPNDDAFKERILALEKQVEQYQTEAIRYRTLFNAFPHGISISDHQGNIVESNAVAEDLLGIGKDEHERRTIDDRDWRIIRPDGSDMPPDEWASVIALKENRVVSDCEMGIVRPDGETTWINVTASPIGMKDGGVVITYNDISERKNYERKLKEANEKLIRSKKELELTLDATTDGIWTWNFRSNQLFFSPQYYTMLGYEPNEFPADFDHWVEMIHPDDRANALAAAETYLKTKPDEYRNEFRLKSKEGGYRWIEAHARVVEWDEQGEAVYMIGNHVDVTERKRYENALSEAKQKYQSMVENIGIGVSMINQKMEVIEMNRQMREWRPGVDLSNKPVCFKVFNDPPAEMVCPWCPTHHTLQDGKVHESITETPEAGGIKNYRVLSSPIVDAKGSVVAAIEMVEDMTDRLKLEERIRQAQKMESIGNLAAGIAHDFNNILFPIIGMAELLLEDLPHESFERENAQEIFSAGKRGSDLVKQILAFSRQGEHQMVPIRIQSILKEVVKLSRSTIPTTIEIKQDIQPNCGMFMGDATQIHQVLMNIVTNAYHALEGGIGKIVIRLKEISMNRTDLDLPDNTFGCRTVPVTSTPINKVKGDGKNDISDVEDDNAVPGRYALLSISDTGHGMSQEVMEKIFDPYFTTKEKGKGTGLGLAVVHGIVKEHRGEIKVCSELGKGTTFEIYLPLMEKAGKNGVKEVAHSLETGHERILLVDDEKSVANLEKIILQRLGYHVTTCYNSLEALGLFESAPHTFDLILSDMAMPNMSGDELAARIKSIRSDIPIIICSGFSEKINENGSGIDGVDAVLMKPVGRVEMAKMVRQVLEKQS